MNSQPTVDVSAALRTAVSSIRRAWLAVLSYAAAIMAIQVLTVFCVSEDLLAKRTFHSSDGYCITVSLLAQTWLWVGLYKLSLNAIRQKSVQVSNLFTAPGIMFRFSLVVLVAVVAAFLVGVGPLLLVLPATNFIRSHLSQEIIVVGVLLLLLPGVALMGYLSLMFSQFPWLLFDNRARYFDSLSQSKQLTKGSLWKLGIAYSVLTLLLLPASVANRIADMYPDMFASNLGPPILLISWVWYVLVSAFGAFVGAALYQQLLDRHQHVNSSQ